jgi:type II secretory pathway component PulC
MTFHFSFSSKVNPNTLAYVNGLNAGDQIISINNRNVTNLTHEEAKMEIIRSGNELELTVIKYDYQSL